MEAQIILIHFISSIIMLLIGFRLGWSRAFQIVDKILDEEVKHLEQEVDKNGQNKIK